MGFMESFPINPIKLDAFKKIVEENHQSNDSLLRDRALAACTYLTAHGYPVGYTLAKEIAQKYFKQFQPFNNQQARQHNESESKEYGRLDLFDEEEKIDRPSSKDILFAFSFFALSLTDPRFKLQLDELTLALNSMPLTLNLVDEAHQYTYHSPSYTPIIDCVSPVISGMFKRILSEHINLVRKKCEQLIVLCKNDSNFVQVYLDLLLDLPQLTLPEHLLGITLNDSHSIFQDASKRAFFLKLIERGTKENVLSFVLDMQNINFRSINLDCLQQIMSALIAKWANDLEVVAKILEIAKSAINPDYEDDGVSTVMYNALLDLTKNVYDQLAGKKTAISFLNLINFLIEKANPNQIEQIKELLKKVFLAQDTSQDQTQSTIQNSIIEKILDNPADERFAMLLEIADEMCLSQYFGVNNRGWDLFGKLLGENSEATLKYLTLFVQTKLTKATDLNSPLSSILDFVNQLLNPLHEHANKWARKFRTEKSQESVSKLLEILEQLRKMNTNESTTKQIQSLITIAENMMEKRRPLLFS
jgi:hypothetical protein